MALPIGQGERPLSENLSHPYDGGRLTVQEVMEDVQHPVRSYLPNGILQGVALNDMEDRYPTQEDFNHLFIYSDMAAPLWRWFLPLINPKINMHGQITMRIWSFLLQCNIHSAIGFVSLYCLMLILWEIWKGRCSARYESKRFSARVVINNVRFMVSNSLDKMHFKEEPSTYEIQLLNYFGFTPHASSKSLKLVRWNPPISGLCLNVDGASKGNPGLCGGGGCIRDENGEIMVAFANFYDDGSSMIAEIRALCDGLRLADFLGCRLSSVHTDSWVLANSIEEGISLVE
ncbi:hypothetical protein Taro_026271 [Colocasia esculenta]|uniref:RNase H type-1 domain-containing protein n=1 Tax=Colocasia esculenta TaxID=4460 RepID=A0A843VCF5_COLES|nr:hypothetical protein [Colocasia esculenta]